MKKDLKRVRKESWKTLEKLKNKQIGVEEAKVISYHHSNVVKSCIAEIQYGKIIKT